MTWIVWRQQRPVFITLAIGLVVVTGAVLLWRTGMVADLTARNLLECAEKGLDACRGRAASEFQSAWYDKLRVAQVLVLAAPALMGIFVGAPLFAREYEQGTHALAFTQSVSRTRWMAAKFLVAAVPALLFVIAFQLLVQHLLNGAGQLGPLDAGPFYFTTFEAQSVSPVAYTIFAYTLGIFTGALFRRTLVAMSLTLGVFVVARVVSNGLRELLVTPTRLVSDDPTRALVLGPGPLQVKGGYLDAKGVEIADPTPLMSCGSKNGEAVDVLGCYRRNGIAQVYSDVIPADQASTLHLLEASIFVGLAALFVLGAVWAVRRQV